MEQFDNVIMYYNHHIHPDNKQKNDEIVVAKEEGQEQQVVPTTCTSGSNDDDDDDNAKDVVQHQQQQQQEKQELLLPTSLLMISPSSSSTTTTTPSSSISDTIFKSLLSIPEIVATNATKLPVVIDNTKSKVSNQMLFFKKPPSSITTMKNVLSSSPGPRPRPRRIRTSTSKKDSSISCTSSSESSISCDTSTSSSAGSSKRSTRRRLKKMNKRRQRLIQQEKQVFRQVMTCNNNAIQALVHNNEDEAIMILRSALKQLKIWQKMDYKVNANTTQFDGDQQQQQHKALLVNDTIQETYMVKLPMLPSQSSSSSSSCSCSSSTVFNQVIQLCTTKGGRRNGSRSMNGTVTTLIPTSFTTSTNKPNTTTATTTTTISSYGDDNTNFSNIATAISPKDIEMCTSVIIFNFAVAYHRKAIKLLSLSSSSSEMTISANTAKNTTTNPTLAKAIATGEELYTMLLSYLDPTISILLGNRPTNKDKRNNRALVRTQELLLIQEREVVPIAILLRLACVNNLLELKSSKVQLCSSHPQYCQNDDEEEQNVEDRDDTSGNTSTTANTFVDDVIEFWSSLWSTTTLPSSSSPPFYSSSPFVSGSSSSYASNSSSSTRTVAPSPTPRWCYDYEKNIEYVNHGILNNLLHDPYSYESKLLYMMMSSSASRRNEDSDDYDEASCVTASTVSMSTATTTTCCCSSNSGQSNFVHENLAMIAAFTYMMKPYVHPLAPFVQLISK